MNKVRTILYAEDDMIVLTAYQTRLAQAGFHVIPARDGLEAMKRLSVFVPDLILLDLMMPRFNGEEVFHFIRSKPVLAKVPVVVLSTNSVLDMAQERLLECANKRLIKHHCTPAILLAAIQEIFAGEPAETASIEPDKVAASFSPVLQTAAA